MRLRRRVLGVVLVLATAVVAAAVETSGFRVGAASATVNPLPGTFMAGYDQDRRSTGVHDDLFAKAVVFDDGTIRLALVVVDCIGLQYDTVGAIRAAAAAQVPGLEAARVVVQSTHTHCGPDVIGVYGKDYTRTGRNAAYMAGLVETAARQVAKAAERLTPAQVVYAETACVGWAVNDSEADVLDNSVTVLQCLDAQGRSVVTLTNFPCHPTVLDGDTNLVSADWVGAFYRAMGAALPGEHLYLQGAIGCWIQPVTPERTFALAERYGRDLAGKTLAALKTPQPLAATALRAARHVFGMPLAEDTIFHMFGEAGLVPRSFGDTVQTEVAWFAIGPAQFATHPAETAPVFARETRALMDTGPKFILGLGLDELGYICPTTYFDRPEDFHAAQYLTKMSPGSEAGAALLGALEKIIP